MVMTRSTAVSTIVVGSIELTFAIITVICGAISSKKLSGQAAASAGLWSLFYAVPGILSISAGASKNTVVMAFALFFNIIAVILSVAATGVCGIFVAALKEVESDHCVQVGDTCLCNHDKYTMKCSDIDTLYAVLIAVTIVYAILTITTFTGSVLGCMGTCCAPADPVVVVTGGMPVQSGSTVVVQSSQSTATGFPVMAPPPSYTQQYGDQNPLVKNMAI